MAFVSTKDTRISQDQLLNLKSKITGYVRDALVYDSGYLVFEVKDLSIFEFGSYYSSAREIIPRFEETRQETVDRILFVIDCKEFHERKQSDSSLDNIITYLCNYVVGFISANILFEKYNVRDHSDKFKDMGELR